MVETVNEAVVRVQSDIEALAQVCEAAAQPDSGMEPSRILYLASDVLAHLGEELEEVANATDTALDPAIGATLGDQG